MTETLTEWFTGFVARTGLRSPKPRSHRTIVKLKPKPKPKLKPKIKKERSSPDCYLCGIRSTSTGRSKASRYARKAKMCGHCYNGRGVRRKEKAASIKKRGVCTSCGIEPIGGGKTRHAARAQKKKVCWRCYGLDRRV